MQTHEPLLQESPDAHAFPHAPQFAGSLSRSVQTPLHVCAHGVHFPLVHFSLAWHFVPHDPQFTLSAVRSTHDPLQTLVGHFTQVPLSQTSPFRHALPHWPQLP